MLLLKATLSLLGLYCCQDFGFGTANVRCRSSIHELSSVWDVSGVSCPSERAASVYEHCEACRSIKLASQVESVTRNTACRPGYPNGFSADLAHMINTPALLSQVVDFHWNPAEPFTLMSVADESSLEKGGGTLQLWRISDLITRPEEEVLAELEPHR